MELSIPSNFESEFYSRSCLFARYTVGLGKDQDYQSVMANAQVAIAGTRGVLVTPNGQYMITMAVNLLARFCKHLALVVPDDIPLAICTPVAYSENLLGCLTGNAREINPLIQLDIVSERRKGLYDAALVIGQYEGELGNTIYINSDGWLAYVDTEGNSFGWASDNPNPIGAYTAACIGVAEIFKALMSKLSERSPVTTASSGSYIFSALDYGFKTTRLINPTLTKVSLLRPIHLISMGAINSALLYTLCSFPRFQCKAFIVEPQTAEVSNLNRYLLLTARDAIQGASKCSVAQKVAQQHLAVKVYPKSYEDYKSRLQSPIDVALVGVDTDESRWHVQDNLPRVLLCGGTEVYQVRVSQHVNPAGQACLGCVYPKRDMPPLPAQPEPVPSISFVSALAGILMAGELIKENSEELQPYALDICLDLDILRMPHFRVTKPQKSEQCGCGCGKWANLKTY